MKSSNVILGEFLSALMLILTSFSCRSSPTGPHVAHNVQLSADYVACTEVWLKISFGDTLGGSFAINRNGNTVLSGHFSGADTTVIDTTALPERTYNYVCWRMVNGLPKDSSSNLQVQTMDTTSNNFSYQLFTFGDWQTGYPSQLNDVTIIDDTDVIGVGEIYVNDSTSESGYPPYNMAVWNGKVWNLRRVPYYSQGTNLYSPIGWVTAFSAEDVWFGNSVHWNGREFFNADEGTSVFYGIGSNEAFGAPGGEMYVIGNQGTIAYSADHGISWHQLQTGTTIDLYDIYSNDGENIYAAGGDLSSDNGILLKGNSGGFQTMMEGKIVTNQNQLFKPYFDGAIGTVWVSSSNTVYFGGGLLYRYRLGQYGLVKSLPGNYFYGNSNGQYWGFISKIRGNADNDMVIVGDGNTIRHFNGISWQQLGMPYDYRSPYTWRSVDMEGNTIVVVGFCNRNAAAMILTRK